MRVVAFAALALLACAAVVSAEEVQGMGRKFPKTVTVYVTYNATTGVSAPITVDAVSKGPWTKRSWNKTPRHAALANFTTVAVTNPRIAAVSAYIIEPTAFVVYQNMTLLRRPVPVTVQYTGVTVTDETVMGWVLVKPLIGKDWRKPHPWDKIMISPHPWDGKHDDKVKYSPHPWDGKHDNKPIHG